MSNNQITTAVKLLQQGKLIAFPTDTVYGIGGDAKCKQAIGSVFSLKNRPTTQALPVLLPNLQHIYHWVHKDSLIPELFLLAEIFWPGPLTIVVKKASTVPNLLTADQDTIAIRVPNHPITLELLKNFNSGIIGSSANKFGQTSAKTCAQVKNTFGDELFVLDGGVCNIGIESTIISLVADPVILREGAIQAVQLKKYLKL